MSIASEITRLQWAKSCIKAAIQCKWVSVPNNLTIDQYANCILQIQQWQTYYDWTPVMPNQSWHMCNDDYCLAWTRENTTGRTVKARWYSVVCSPCPWSSSWYDTLVFCVSTSSSHWYDACCAARASWPQYCPYCTWEITVNSWQTVYMHLQWWNAPWVEYWHRDTRIEVKEVN